VSVLHILEDVRKIKQVYVQVEHVLYLENTLLWAEKFKIS
jgi:hypothetical protein